MLYGFRTQRPGKLFFQRVQPDLRKSGIGNYHKGSAIFSNLKIYYKL